jgi:uncharacterized membrane protein
MIYVIAVIAYLAAVWLIIRFFQSVAEKDRRVGKSLDDQSAKKNPRKGGRS